MSDERIPDKFHPPLMALLDRFVRAGSEWMLTQGDARKILKHIREATAKCTCGHERCSHDAKGKCCVVSYYMKDDCPCTKFVPKAAES